MVINNNWILTAIIPLLCPAWERKCRPHLSLLCGGVLITKKLLRTMLMSTDIDNGWAGLYNYIAVAFSVYVVVFVCV